MQREASRTLREFLARQEALADDTTAAGREKRARLEQTLDSAMRSLSYQRSRVLNELTRRAAEDTRFRVQRGQAAPMSGEEPVGWLGVSLEAEGTSTMGVIRYAGYPTIVSVEPGSPAQRAGIAAGDKLMALGGRDVTTGSVQLEKLLQPGRQLPVRLQRGGEVKTVMVEITRRPAGPYIFSEDPPGQATIRFRAMTPGEAEARARASGAPRMVVPLPFSPGGTLAVVGAEFTTVRGDLAEYFGTSAGVLVLRLGVGTPAQRAGLREGDVIVAADGHEVANVNALQMMFARAADHSIKLDLIRRRERKTVTLSW